MDQKHSLRSPAGVSAGRFDPKCRACPRLAAHLDRVTETHPDYHARPVAAFGAARPRLLIVGLAPGLHGANATGRPFTGDYAGILLYRTLHEFGFASRPQSQGADDGLELIDCRITNAVRCLPPQNKPSTAEIDRCNPFLRDELAQAGIKVVLALGGIAHRAVLKALGCQLSAFAFGHGAWHQPGAGPRLVDSYHCSRYNTQTRRLTEPMFGNVFAAIRRELDAAA